MGEINIEFEIVTNPRSYEAQESMILCRSEFEMSNYEARGIIARLLNPTIIWPNRFYYLVAKQNETIVGLAIFYFLSEVNLGYLEYIAVQPGFRGLGIGRKLYQKVVESLKQVSPHLNGVIFEVRNVPKGLEARKEFFRKVGALPIDLSLYPLKEEIVNSGLMLMLDPMEDINMTWPVVSKTLDNLTRVLVS